MPKYAQTDSTGHVVGWYNTDARKYPLMPPLSELTVVTDAQWQARLSDPNGWAVVNGHLVPWTAPVPVATLAQQAQAAALAGFTISLSGSITLAATKFPTDAGAQRKLAAVITTLLATGTFPGGLTSYPMIDSGGAWHSFDLAVYKTVAGAIGDYVAACDLIADGYSNGATSLPSSSIALKV